MLCAVQNRLTYRFLFVQLLLRLSECRSCVVGVLFGGLALISCGERGNFLRRMLIEIFSEMYNALECMWWRSGLMHCAGRSRIRFPMVSLTFHWHNPSGRPMALGSTEPGIFPGGWRWPLRRANNLTTFMCWISWNLGTSASWNPQGLSGPVQGLL